MCWELAAAAVRTISDSVAPVLTACCSRSRDLELIGCWCAGHALEFLQDASASWLQHFSAELGDRSAPAVVVLHLPAHTAPWPQEEAAELWLQRSALISHILPCSIIIWLEWRTQLLDHASLHTHNHTLTHSLSPVLVVVMGSMELKTSRSLMLIL